MINLHKKLGLANVALKEPLWVRRIGRAFEIMSLVILIILAWQWEMDQKGVNTYATDLMFNGVVWLFFTVQTALLTALVADKLCYLRQNWFNLLIIVLGVVLFFSPSWVEPLYSLRLLLVLWLLLPWLDACWVSLSDNRLGTTLVTAVFVMLLAGIIMAGIDPAVKSPMEGIWLAWVTASTVGYGDVVPVSGLGRVFGAVLILMGLGLFSVITANFSALFIQRGFRAGVKEMEKGGAEIRVLLAELQEVRREEDAILAVLENIQHRIDQLEQRQRGSES